MQGLAQFAIARWFHQKGGSQVPLTSPGTPDSDVGGATSDDGDGELSPPSPGKATETSPGSAMPGIPGGLETTTGSVSPPEVTPRVTEPLSPFSFHSRRFLDVATAVALALNECYRAPCAVEQLSAEGSGSLDPVGGAPPSLG